jgi:hypothetical protein
MNPKLRVQSVELRAGKRLNAAILRALSPQLSALS